MPGFVATGFLFLLLVSSGPVLRLHRPALLQAARSFAGRLLYERQPL